MPIRAAGNPAMISSIALRNTCLIQHPLLRRALRPRGHHVLLADFLEKRVLRQQRERRETAEHQGQRRQHHVPRVIDDPRRP